MPSDEDKIGAALAAGLMGLGVGAIIGAALATQPDPHTVFMSRLREGLAPAGIGLVAADLGRGLLSPVWVLTLRLPNGNLMNLQAPVAPATNPLAPVLGDGIAQRIIGYFRSHGLLTL